MPEHGLLWVHGFSLNSKVPDISRCYHLYDLRCEPCSPIDSMCFATVSRWKTERHSSKRTRSRQRTPMQQIRTRARCYVQFCMQVPDLLIQSQSVNSTACRSTRRKSQLARCVCERRDESAAQEKKQQQQQHEIGSHYQKEVNIRRRTRNLRWPVAKRRR